MLKIIKSADLTSQQLEKLLTKPAFDQVELSAGIKKGIWAMFGEELTAKQVVEKILQAVRAEGDLVALQGALVGIADQRPAVLLDAVNIQAQGVPERGVQRLSVQFSFLILRRLQP